MLLSKTLNCDNVLVYPGIEVERFHMTERHPRRPRKMNFLSLGKWVFSSVKKNTLIGDHYGRHAHSVLIQVKMTETYAACHSIHSKLEALPCWSWSNTKDLNIVSFSLSLSLEVYLVEAKSPCWGTQSFVHCHLSSTCKSVLFIVNL